MISIVTDSSAYFKKAEAAQLGVRVVPMSYTVNGRNYFETYIDHNGDFKSLLAEGGKYTTSQPSYASFLSCFEEELALGNEVLCVTISSRLSGTFSTAYMAAKQTGSDKVCVFDSHLTAGGLHLLILKAKELADSGLSLPELIKELMSVRGKITTSFSVEDMTPLRNSGRIGFMRLSVGTILNIKPILRCVDGIVVADEMARGSTEMLKKLFYKIDSDTKHIVINYIGNERLATNLYNVISGALPSAKLKLQQGGPVLGIHLGPQVIGVSFIAP